MAEPYSIRSDIDHEDPGYAPLPGGAELRGRRGLAKPILVGLSVLLVVGVMISFLTNTKSDGCTPFNDALLSTNRKGAAPRSIPAEATVGPVSRGVREGVSEKSNRIFAGVNVKDFPWNNSMLSWQRTAYHFQPEKNWMNGELFSLFAFLFLSFHGISFL